MKIGEKLKKFWAFLKKDSWQSWIVSLVLAFVFIKVIFFPVISFALGTSLPLVVIESCSMYHTTGFDDWWERNALWYERKEIFKYDFEEFSFNGGLNKGDIILVSGRGGFELGDVIIFNSIYKYPLIHRVVDEKPIQTKGDHNLAQLPGGVEENINEDFVRGKAVARVPGLGWVKLIFFEHLKAPEDRGFCK